MARPVEVTDKPGIYMQGRDDQWTMMTCFVCDQLAKENPKFKRELFLERVDNTTREGVRTNPGKG